MASQFELPAAVKARILDVVVLSQKNRQPDENPGAKVVLLMKLPNDALAMFDGFLRGMLFTSAPGAAPRQGNLESVPAVSTMAALTAIGRSLGRFKWDLEVVGYTLTLAHGIGGATDVKATGCSVKSFFLTAQEGGTIELKCVVEAPDVTAGDFGRLAKMKRIETDITLKAPTIAQRAIDEVPASTAAKKTLPAPLAAKKAAPAPAAKKKSTARQTAEEAFAEAHAPKSDVGVLTNMHGKPAAH